MADQFNMVSSDIIGSKSLTDDLDTKWNDLDGSFKDYYTSVTSACADYDNLNSCKGDVNDFSDEHDALTDSKKAYLTTFLDVKSKLEGSNEISNQYKDLNEKALRRPINISFGIMLLLTFIYELMDYK